MRPIRQRTGHDPLLRPSVVVLLVAITMLAGVAEAQAQGPGARFVYELCDSQLPGAHHPRTTSTPRRPTRPSRTAPPRAAPSA